MRRPRDLALHTGLYVAAAITGVAAAYVLKEYVLHFWDSWSRNRSICNDANDKTQRDDRLETKHESRIDPTLGRPAANVGRSPTTISPSSSSLPESCPSNDNTTSPGPPSPSQRVTEVPREEEQPVAAQTRILPPLNTHSLPPPLPNAKMILSGAHPDTDAATTSLSHITSPAMRSLADSISHTWMMVGSENESVTEGGREGDGDRDVSQVSSPVSESLIEILSPPPPQEISRRRSLRSHDLFAASHISFSELGSLVTEGLPN